MPDSEKGNSGGESAGDGNHFSESRDEPQGFGRLTLETLKSALDYFDARLRLFILDAVEARGSLLRRAIAAIVGLIFLILSYAAFLGAGIALVTDHFGWPWPYLTLAVAGFHFLIGVVLLLRARSRREYTPFRDTLAEFEKDREWLERLRNRDR